MKTHISVLKEDKERGAFRVSRLDQSNGRQRGLGVAGLAQRQDDAVGVESRRALHVLGASVAGYLGRRSGRPLLGAGARIVVRSRSRRSKGVDVDAEQDGDDEEGHYISDTSPVNRSTTKLCGDVHRRCSMTL